eukprot:scaffold10478_cov48-Phaeocystis_antarctica.AAC.3
MEMVAVMVVVVVAVAAVVVVVVVVAVVAVAVVVVAVVVIPTVPHYYYYCDLPTITTPPPGAPYYLGVVDLGERGGAAPSQRGHVLRRYALRLPDGGVSPSRFVNAVQAAVGYAR